MSVECWCLNTTIHNSQIVFIDWLAPDNYYWTSSIFSTQFAENESSVESRELIMISIQPLM